LGAGVIEADGLTCAEELRIAVLGPDQLLDRARQVGVRHDRPSPDRAAVDHHARHPALLDQNPLRIAADPHVHAVAEQFPVHHLNEPVGAALENEHPLDMKFENTIPYVSAGSSKVEPLA